MHTPRSRYNVRHIRCSVRQQQGHGRGVAGEPEPLRRLQHLPALSLPRRPLISLGAQQHGLPLLHQRRRRTLPRRGATHRHRNYV
jgi:hypothetical protein